MDPTNRFSARGKGRQRPASAMGLRAASSLSLGESVETLRGVSSVRAKALGKLGVSTLGDLLRTPPLRYVDFTSVSAISACRIGDDATVMGTVDSVRTKTVRRRMRIVEVSVVDGTGVMQAVWFNQPWIAESLEKGTRVVLQGTVGHSYGFLQMRSPNHLVLGASGEGDADRPIPSIVAVYRQTKGITSAWISRIVSEACDRCLCPIDFLPAYIRAHRNLMSLTTALTRLHFPSSMDEVAMARRRLAYEELLLLQLHWGLERLGMEGEGTAFAHNTDGPLLHSYLETLPYELSEDQASALDSILSDMASDRRMHRMLLGDVGTGKTAVAAAALACAADSGGQGVLMAPTEVLARQYGAKIGPVFDAVGITWATLTASTPASDRAQMLASLANGQLSVLFCTHAVLEDDVVFYNMTLAVVDEQHRFGVGQRDALRAKGPSCDYLCMTATPIPRSLALTLYGNLDCSSIRQRPGGNREIATELVDKRNAFIAYEAVQECVSAGQQAYIVCPLVGQRGTAYGGESEEDENVGEQAPFGEEDLERAGGDLKAARAEAQFLSTKIFPELRVELLCGGMPALEKARVMGDFRDGLIDVLVSTTVVEVGVDVPNATLMVVEDAERFGLSQLHQLRGRVGRGEHPGRMILLADARTEIARRRMEAMCSIQDGFELAEMDLELRHEGDVSGLRQHGMPGLRFSNVVRDADLVYMTREDAGVILRDDPSLSEPAHALLRAELEERYGQTGDERVERIENR